MSKAKLSKTAKTATDGRQSRTAAADAPQNRPLATVKLASVDIDDGVGPNVEVKITVADGPTIDRIGDSSDGKWLFQKPVDSSSLSIHLEMSEIDPVYTDTASGDKTLAIDLTSPPTSGNDSFQLKITAVGGDKGKSALSTFGFTWYVTSNVEDVIGFIFNKMSSNVGGPEFTQVQTDFNAANKVPLKERAMISSFGITEFPALVEFAELVATGHVWDYKKDILPIYGEWSLDGKNGILYDRDIWGNIHYGYIGRAIGFREDELLDGAGLGRAIFELKIPKETLLKELTIGKPKKTGREYDQPKDQVAIRVGMHLWESKGAGITVEDILDAVRHESSNLNTSPASEGKPPSSFLLKLGQ